MAKKSSSKKTKQSDSTVVRIKASDSAPKKGEVKTNASEPKVVKAEATEPKVRKKRSAKGILRPFAAIGAYFKGAWVELRQVRWPTRRATWGLTGAVLVYSAFFVVLVLLLDAGFKYLFELILGK